jgi:uncharacterized protein (TIGR03437 family)
LQGNKLVGTLTGANAVEAAQGSSVAISGDGNTLLIGGKNDSFYEGAIWVFTRSGSTWSQQARLSDSNSPSTMQGTSVALSGDGNTAVAGGVGSGGVAVAWVYTRSGSTWAQQGNKLVGTGAVGISGVGVVPGDGVAVSLSSDGNTAIVGGIYDNNHAGAAWIYTRSGNTWSQRGNKLVGTGAAGTASQGASAALSGDASTAIVGGGNDNQGAGAIWVYAGPPPPQAPKPAISGVVNDASFTAGGAISPGSWVAIFGSALAPTGISRKWNESIEIVNGKLPVSLEGTSVTVNGKAAAVEFVQPSQVNIQPPDDTAVGPVQVVVTTPAGASNPITVNYAKFAPGLFPAAPPYIVAQHADNSYVTTAKPATPGETIILWGTGFGLANPAVPAGQVISGATPLANQVTVTIGGQSANVDFAGVVGAGLVQINVHVPSSMGNGDAAVVASVGGVSTQMTDNVIPVHN